MPSRETACGFGFLVLKGQRVMWGPDFILCGEASLVSWDHTCLWPSVFSKGRGFLAKLLLGSHLGGEQKSWTHSRRVSFGTCGNAACRARQEAAGVTHRGGLEGGSGSCLAGRPCGGHWWPSLQAPPCDSAALSLCFFFSCHQCLSGLSPLPHCFSPWPLPLAFGHSWPVWPPLNGSEKGAVKRAGVADSGMSFKGRFCF